MELEHFVFGKLSVDTKDHRAILQSSNIRDNIVSALLKKLLSGFKFNSSLQVFQPQLILQVEHDVFAYVQLYFDKNYKDIMNREVNLLFHAFVFNERELSHLSYAPWKIRKYFIEKFESEGVIGYDGEVWGAKDEKKIIPPIPYVPEEGGRLIEKSYNNEEKICLIQTYSPYELLNSLNIEQRKFILQNGILIIDSLDLVQRIKDINFILYRQRSENDVIDGVILNSEEFKNIQPLFTPIEKPTDPGKERIIRKKEKPTGSVFKNLFMVFSGLGVVIFCGLYFLSPPYSDPEDNSHLIDSLRNINEKLQNELDTMEISYTIIVNDDSVKAGNIGALQEIMNNLKYDLDQKKQDYKNLQDTLNKKGNQIIELEQNTTNLSDTIDEMKIMISELKNESTKRKDAINKNEQKIAELENQNKNLKITIKTLGEELQDKETQIEELKAKILQNAANQHDTTKSNN